MLVVYLHFLFLFFFLLGTNQKHIKLKRKSTTTKGTNATQGDLKE